MCYNTIVNGEDDDSEESNYRDIQYSKRNGRNSWISKAGSKGSA